MDNITTPSTPSIRTSSTSIDPSTTSSTVSYNINLEILTQLTCMSGGNENKVVVVPSNDNTPD